MNFREKLALGHSKLFTNQIVNEINKHPEKMDELMQIFMEGPVQFTQRAAWAISVVAEKHPEFLLRYYDLFISLLNQPNKHNSINRNIVRALQYSDIPEKYEGQILDVTFRLMNSPNEPIAVKVFCMTVIFNLSKKYPDIKPELKMSIEQLLPEGSAGIKSRGKKILKALEK
ncbi:MAG: hypothetical protein KDD29_10540 [Flavobacteriales bacterium]|nr:hypothetical protein [Flavobacteriales bacterium]